MQMAMKIVEMRIMPRVMPQELTASPGKTRAAIRTRRASCPPKQGELNIIVDSEG
ncbi:hypothetical protein GCM10010987_31400 [Bradyrhizobium guangdongense]|uniref:Uncharacterized protein n=1 Tax=Bradyrhizobium guangdongense TaxID=1325090 RepID=A0AA87W412_9BRAD|nr:hypothetical protein GCM10010987_31400 [Bradyrhizobium guangdongense]